MWCAVGGAGSAEREFEGEKNVITYRWSELISIDIHWFCMTAARPTEERQSKGVLLMADKGVYHLQKVGIATPGEARVQVTHQQNTVGFLYGLLTSTKPGTCVPSLQAEGAETLPAKCSLFPAPLSVYGWTSNMWAEICKHVQRRANHHMFWCTCRSGGRRVDSLVKIVTFSTTAVGPQLCLVLPLLTLNLHQSSGISQAVI